MPSNLAHEYEFIRSATLNKQRFDANDSVLPSNPSKIMRYWNELRGKSFAPKWEDFEIVQLPPLLIPWSAVVDVVGPPDEFVYRYWGTARVRYHGEDFTGKAIIGTQDTSITDVLIDEYNFVVEQHIPLYVKTECEFLGEKLFFEFLRLPLSSDGTTVNKVYSVGFSGEGPEGEFMTYDSLQ
jgi:hypothetical protein